MKMKNDRVLRVLLVTNMFPDMNDPNYGIFIKEQEEAVCAQFHHVEVTVYSIQGKKSKLEYIKSIFSIRRLLGRNRFDLIHIHYGLSGLFLLFGPTPDVPIVMTLHGGDILPEQGKRYQVGLTKRILRKVDAVISLNGRMDQLVKAYNPNTFIIPCAVDMDLFSPSMVKRKKESSQKKKIVFPSSRERYIKNYSLFERTIHLLSSSYGIECETYEVKDLKREEVALLFQSADLLLMTSLSEGSPQVVKEAMACNLPVISTDVGDVAFLLKDVYGSAVSKAMDAEELARLCMRSLTAEMDGIPGRTRLLQLGLDKETTASSIYSLYESLVVR